MPEEISPAVRQDNRPATLLRAALLLRCPACKTGKLFAGPWRMHPVCPCCGLRFEREEGYYLGSTYILFIATYFSGIAAYIAGALIFGWSNRVLIFGVLAGVLLLPLLMWRWARAGWLAFDQLVQPRESGAGPES